MRCCLHLHRNSRAVHTCPGPPSSKPNRPSRAAQLKEHVLETSISQRQLWFAGVSFCGRRGWAHGLLVTLAIGIHNIPEGLAVATVLVSRGTTPRKALEWTLLCALPQPLFAVPSFIFVESFKMLLPVSMGFAAGCMLWIVVAELLPDALEDMPAGALPAWVLCSSLCLLL